MLLFDYGPMSSERDSFAKGIFSTFAKGFLLHKLLLKVNFSPLRVKKSRSHDMGLCLDEPTIVGILLHHEIQQQKQLLAHMSRLLQCTTFIRNSRATRRILFSTILAAENGRLFKFPISRGTDLLNCPRN
jgi:hypothetical protein